MILLVFSDSHGFTDAMDAAIEQETCVNGIVFCGDIARDADHLRERYPNIPLYAVRGNNDYECYDPYLRIIRIENVPIYITHGHRERVKFGYLQLLLRAEEQNCSLVLYGHTHAASDFTERGVRFVNPGSIRSSRGSYARICLENGTVSVTHCSCAAPEN